MRLSLVIPCYNEAASLALLLKQCQRLAAMPSVEVILVDNGSTDNSPLVLEQLLPHYPGCSSIRIEHNLGYGHGILEGLRVARGEILAWTHADLQADPLDAIHGLKLFDKFGDDIFVKGRRYGRPFFDVLFTFGMSVFETLLLARPMFDINAQPTMFARQFFDNWHNPPNDFSLDLYAYYQAHRYKLKVYRFPVKFGERAHGTSHWNINWTAKWKFIRRTVSFSLTLRKMSQK
jgi:glycosyltransferase involved in cell wall biosynthesis